MGVITIKMMEPIKKEDITLEPHTSLRSLIRTKQVPDGTYKVDCTTGNIFRNLDFFSDPNRK